MNYDLFSSDDDSLFEGIMANCPRATVVSAE